MSICDSYFFNDEETVDGFGIFRKTKTRLTKYIEKKTGKFIRWSIDVKTEVDMEQITEDVIENERDMRMLLLSMFSHLGNKKVMKTATDEELKMYDQLFPYATIAESGVFDYTEDGLFFDLTTAQKDRALTKRIPYQF